MGKLCVVYGCHVTSTNKDSISTHSFPKEPLQIRRAWINFVKTTRKDFDTPKAHNVICARHFTSDAFVDRYTAPLFEAKLGYRPKRKLKTDAVPSLITDECAAALHRLTAAERTVEAADKAESARRKRMRKREAVKASIERFHFTNKR